MRYFVLGGIGIILLLVVWVIIRNHNSPSHRAVQTGPLTIDGIVTSTGISLIRRGTHVLSVDGESLYYLESPHVNLDDVEGKHVTAKGTVEHNVSDEFLPVLVVDSITASDSSSGKEKLYPSLGIAFVVPDDWSINVQGGTISAYLSGSTVPFLTMRHDGQGSLSESGQTIRLGGRPGERIDRPDGSRDIKVSDDPGILLLQLVPAPNEQDRIDATFDDFLLSLRFLASSSQASSKAISGTGSSIVCGGAAGILCPEGSYCEITDHEVNTGVCRQVH